ncbi:Rha family transcriptional regulator [Gracilibacillus dipsosauri]|uniref:Phage regulatory protein n=1 Tax=Gracilibacillus dipsosauri TaxID=178340 RepID=A0A317KXT0_9BACI|nr:Rha family transcriptional regulator [Gracilibacillus dipsosauri]PWU68297.1 phage regulatory protein [Gracilibacillus dipsosauri]
MNELVFIQDNQVVTDSLTVAEVFNKSHNHVLRDIATQLEKLSAAGEEEWGMTNFGQTRYQNTQNNQWYTKYNLTEDAFAIIAMSYVTPEAMKMKIKFLDEFKKMKKALEQPHPLSERDRLIASMKLTIESAEKLEGIEEDVANLRTRFDNELTLNHGQATSLNHAVKKRVEKLWNSGWTGVLESKSQMYSNLYSQLKRAFHAPTYREIKRIDFDEAMNWVNAWRPL